MRITWDDLTVNFDDFQSEDLLKDWRWLIGSSAQPILISSVGDAFIQDETGKVFWLETGAGPKLDDRLPLQVLQRLGSFLNCLSKKNNCSPAVKVKSVPQSMHFNTLSWNSIWRCSPFSPVLSHLLTERAQRPFRRAQDTQELRTHPPQLARVFTWTRPATPTPAWLLPNSLLTNVALPKVTTWGIWQNNEPPPGVAARTSTNPALYAPFYGYASVPTLLSPASSLRALDKTNGALLP